MNNPNPFVPKGSLLEQQNKRRVHMRLGVLCVLSVSVVGLLAVLIQGCKKSEPPADNQFPSLESTNPTPATTESNPAPPVDAATSNVPPVMPPPITPSSNVSSTTPPLPNNAQMPQQLPPPPSTPVANQLPTGVPAGADTGSAEYVVAKGDSLAKIAKKQGVTVKALEAANPDAKPTKLKVGQKLVIPAGGKSVAEAQTPSAGADVAAAPGSQTYTVKSGDTLHKIAKAHHVSVKALMSANGLTTTQIKVGKKLKIPAKAEAAVAQTQPEPSPAPDSSMPAPPTPQSMPAAPTPSNTGAPLPH